MTMRIENSIKLMQKAKILIPGGVNSPVRAFKSVGGDPIFIKSAKGSKLYDVDGNEYIDYLSSWGPHIFGHNPDFIIETVNAALKNGTSFGTPTELEVRMAELVCELIPSVQMVRMVNSGTEATMSAVRLARGYTGKDKIIKFEGCYHGHGDSFLIKAGSGALTFGVPTSPGVSKACASDTLVAQFNDIDSVKKLIHENKNDIAGIIIEPVAGNMGVIPADKNFLQELRGICSDENIVLIFDEVMTGFRVAKGGAQELYNIMPDLTTLGKIIGGGFPVGAFGGRSDIMEHISPVGPVYQAGTLSGNPIAMAAGVAALNHIKNNPGIYDLLERKASSLESGMNTNLAESGNKLAINRVGSMLCQYCTASEVNNFKSGITSDTEQYAKYFHHMLNNGIHLAPAQFEAMFISTAHTDKDLDRTIKAHGEFFRKVFVKK
jgi:glutamate-1-semialdehyde 2,1-aminomutase